MRENAQFTGVNAGHPVRRTALAKRDRGCSAAAHGKRGDDAGPGLYFNQAQKHYQQLLLMEERATIARELHDSLAQVLSYLRIQLTLLKHAVPGDNAPAQAIITDFSRELYNARISYASCSPPSA